MSGLWLRRPGYRGTAFARLCSRPLRLLPAAGVLVSLAMSAGGCSYRMDSLARSSDRELTTGSIRKAPAARPQEQPQGKQAAMLPERDLAAARAAVIDALGKGGNDTSVPWEDPATGARGTVTPLSNAYSQDGATCRDFLASYVRNGSESWLQGEACRVQQGRWEVRQMRPWRT